MTFLVRGHPEQPGEVDQAAAAHHAGDLPAQERRRHVTPQQGHGRVPDHAAHLQTLARRKNLPVKKIPESKNL